MEPDGKRLATADGEGLVEIYAMDIHDLMALALPIPQTKAARSISASTSARRFLIFPGGNPEPQRDPQKAQCTAGLWETPQPSSSQSLSKPDMNSLMDWLR